MQRGLKIFFGILLICFGLAVRVTAVDCAICGQEIWGTVFLLTDPSTGQKLMVCSNCAALPRCFICGLPAYNGTKLEDGRWLCEKDAKTAVLDVHDIRQIFGEVHDDLDRQFSRFTSFPTNIDVCAIDRIDVDSMYELYGKSLESPDLLGFTEPISANGAARYKIGLINGQSQAQLEEVCAHELSHAWVGENVPKERHDRLARDAEEGFCEMMGYLYVDSKGEEGEKKRVMENLYTRGQVKLFVEAEQEYGFDEILDWMQYGVDPKLEEGHLDIIRDVKMPTTRAVTHLAGENPIVYAAVHAPPAPATIELQGIMWGTAPSAIINGRSFFKGDEFKVQVGTAKVSICCLTIHKTSVRIKNVDSGQEQYLALPKN